MHSRKDRDRAGIAAGIPVAGSLSRTNVHDRRRPLVRRISLLFCVAIVVVSAVILSVSGPAAAADNATFVPGVSPASAELRVAISGRFRDFTTGQAIGGARVTVVKQDGSPAGMAVADAAGDFTLTVETVAGAQLTTVYEAAGYLREESVVRATEPQLRIEPLLTPRGVKEAVLYSLSGPLVGQQLTSPGLAGAVAISSATLAAVTPALASAAALNPPATIRVYRASLGVVQVVDFKFYCKHVLPSEWLREWPVESLRAGAMAVEEYAWYYVSTGGKWPSLGADVRDDYADQKYDPAVSDPRTDAAVDYIWGSYVLRSGGLFVIQYCGDSSLDAVYRCPIHPSRMPQWGTFYLARDKGWNWQQIIHYYWDPVSIITDPATSYTRYEQGNTNIAKTGTWKDYLTTGPSGGSYGRSSTPGAKATIYFTGTRIDWIGMKGITPGIVEVYLDDVLKATLDLYAPSAKYQVMLWSSGTLTNGTHHMDLVRAKASLSTEYLVLDAVDIYGGNIIAAPSAYTRYEQGNTNIAKTGTWKDYLTTGPSGGSYGRSSTPGAKATIYFTGTRIDWIGMKGITPGIVEVYLDDVLKATLDLYAPSAKYQVMLWSSGTLTNGTHHMDLVRAKASLSTEYLVLDAVDIYGGNIIAGP